MFNNIRALVRLALLRNHGYKMLLHGGENPNEGNESDALKLQSGYGNRTQNRQHLGQTHLEGRALSALSRFGENARRVSEPAWLRRVQHQQAIMEPTGTYCIFIFFPRIRVIFVSNSKIGTNHTQLQWLRDLPFPVYCQKRVFLGAFLYWGRLRTFSGHLYMFYWYGNMEFVRGFLGQSHWPWTWWEWAFFRLLQHHGVLSKTTVFIYPTLKRMRLDCYLFFVENNALMHKHMFFVLYIWKEWWLDGIVSLSTILYSTHRKIRQVWIWSKEKKWNKSFL